MKKILYTIILGTAVILSACNRDERNLFDQSAAERVDTKRQQLVQYLLEAPNGWELQYFPHPDAAGYALLCEFSKDGSVYVAAKNKISSSSLLKDEVSSWSIDATQGVVLSFCTYNTLLSIFADPGSDGVGYEGDYEFVYMDGSADKIQLKGKKHGAYLTMTALKVDQDWEDYFRQIDAFNLDAFLGNDGITMSYLNGDTVTNVTYDDGTFSYKDTADTEISKGFIITPRGLHFYSGMPQANTEKLAQDFYLNANKDKLVCAENEMVFFSSNYTEAEFINYKFEQMNRWVYDEAGTDAETVAAVNEIKALAAANGAEITRIAYDFYLRTLRDKVIKTYALYISYLVENKLYEGRINLLYTNDGETITYRASTAESQLDPLMFRIDANKSVATKKFTDIFCDSYTIASYSGSHLNMIQMMMNSTTNANKHIHVNADITK